MLNFINNEKDVFNNIIIVILVGEKSIDRGSCTKLSQNKIPAPFFTKMAIYGDFLPNHYFFSLCEIKL